MAYKIVIKDPAKDDMQDAYDHYENERKGLGDDLESTPNHYG